MPSSVIAAMQYDPETLMLRVIFVSGMVYEYKKVPAEVYEGMRTSVSKGKYLNEQIKGKYDFVKVK